MFVFGDAVGFDFLFIRQTLAIFTVEVVGCASTRLQGCRGVGRQGNDLLDALVLRAVDKR
jgi:hypothetical protein